MLNQKNKPKSLSAALIALKKMRDDNDVENKTVDDVVNEIEKTKQNITLSQEKILEVDPSLIKRWEYKNRPSSELHNIAELANKIKLQGQQEPCIVRPINDNGKYQYELISGERRWHAVQLINKKLLVIVRELNNLQASITQKEENDKSPVSDYANGLCYAKQIKDGIISQKDLTEHLGISKQQVSRLLSYSKIPSEVVEAIGDMSLVSPGTAEKIKQLCLKGNKYKEKIILVAPKIKEGKLGHEKLSKMVLEGDLKKCSSSEKIKSNKGKHLFTFKKENNKQSIQFTKEVSSLMQEKNIDINSIVEKIRVQLEKELDI